MPAVIVTRPANDACDEPGCREPAVLRLDVRGGEDVRLCREHSRAVAREILQHVHGVVVAEQKPLPASQRGFGG